jgi:hypothetical protein
LLARYVVGYVLSTHSLHHLTEIFISILHQRNFFATVTPVNYNTVATPHIGLLRYPSLFSRLGSFFGPRVLSRTGEQFYGTDKWSNTGKALLEVMADPGEEPSLSRYCLADSQPRTRVLQRSQAIPPYSNIRECVSLIISQNWSGGSLCIIVYSASTI